MSNTVKIKNRKKKKEIKVNYRLWAIIFGIFVAAIVILAVWASFHWGVGMGTIGVRPENPENVEAGATDAASLFATEEDAAVAVPEQNKESQKEVESSEGAEAPAKDDEAGAAGEAVTGGAAGSTAEAAAGQEAGSAGDGETGSGQ